MPSLPLHFSSYVLLYWPDKRHLFAKQLHELTDLSSFLQKFHRTAMDGYGMYIEYSMFMHQFAEGAVFNT